MRTILLIMTLLGGLLAFVAAVWVAVLSTKDRWLKHNLARLGDEVTYEMKRHSQAYQDYNNQRNERQRTGQGPVPVPPFGGMDEKAHEDQVNAEYLRRVEARMGRDPLQPESDRDVHRDVLYGLLWPAVLAGLGVAFSTIASALSLCLPPNI